MEANKRKARPLVLSSIVCDQVNPSGKPHFVPAGVGKV
jgi:hypothetical protein